MSDPRWNRTIGLVGGPGTLRFYWIRVLSLMRFIPRVTVTLDPGDCGGEPLLVTYWVYLVFPLWNGSRQFYGIPDRVRPADRSDDFIGHGRRWMYTACDRIKFGARNGRDEVQVHVANSDVYPS